MFLKSLLFTVIAPGTVAGFLPYWILTATGAPAWPEPGAVSLLGTFVFLAGVATYFWCLWDFAVVGHGTPAPIDPPRELVVRGLYRLTRNPMYVGVLSVVLGESIFFRSPWLLGYAALVFTVFHLFVVAYEEPTLRANFGAAYERYREAVPRWLGPRRLRGACGRRGA